MREECSSSRNLETLFVSWQFQVVGGRGQKRLEVRGRRTVCPRSNSTLHPNIGNDILKKFLSSFPRLDSINRKIDLKFRQCQNS